jgi:hypothetical protein
MPILINLLAEQHAAEEQRRRDPVKRAIWVGSSLVALMLIWAAMIQLSVGSARSELNTLQAKLEMVENNSKEIRSSWEKNGLIESRLINLEKYTTNRFFYGHLLDAMQRTFVENVRVVGLLSSHAYITNVEKSIKTNFSIPYVKRSAWKFWASDSGTNIHTLITNVVNAITNRTEFLTNQVPLIIKQEVSTNASRINAKVEVIRPILIVEQIVLTIQARDYSNPPGRQVDEFYKAVAASPYFKEHLHKVEGQGLKFKERAIQTAVDPLDPLQPTVPFIAFTLECKYRDQARSNE